MASRRAKAREFRGAAPGGKTHGVRDVRLGRVDRPHLLGGATERSAEAEGGGRGPGEHREVQVQVQAVKWWWWWWRQVRRSREQQLQQ